MDIETAAAHALSANPVAAFAVALAVLLSCTWGLWAACRAAIGPAGRRALLPLVMACALVAAGATLLFAETTEAMEQGEALGRFDSALSSRLGEGLPPAAWRVFAGATRLADTSTLTGLCVFVAAVLLRRRRWTLAVGWITAVAGNAVLNKTLKGLFERARPEQALAYGGDAAGFSFPSGHSSGSVAAYGMLAYLALRLCPPRWQLPALLTAVAAIFTVGCSRVLLQVHYPSDVLAGFASGMAWLVCCIAAVECWQAARRRREG